MTMIERWIERKNKKKFINSNLSDYIEVLQYQKKLLNNTHRAHTRTGCLANRMLLSKKNASLLFY